ncbi:MAG TPA: hypothetical protein VN873_12735 [Candidatus Angelobacter sp.]|nr:hypothetical protein [Candidatus Angelobacter sp.]
MDAAAETKICPFCAETIKMAAKKCPFCNSRLGRFPIFRQELMAGLAALILYGSFIFVCASVWPDDSDGSRYPFERHRNELKVVNVNVTVENQESNKYYYAVSGFVTNRGRLPWRVQEFELTVTNAQGAPDVVHASVANPFVVQPGDEHAFAFHRSTTLTNRVLAARARVENARDGNAPAKPISELP